MADAIDALASGRVRAPSASALPLSRVREAHERLDAPDTLGKIVLHP
jgi:NADPH:quinone reductase